MGGKELVAKLDRAYTEKWSETVQQQLSQMGINGEELARSARRHVVDIRPTMSAPPRRSSASAPKTDSTAR